MLRNLQEAKDRLMQEVVRYEDNCVAFKSLLQEKDKELDDLSARIKAGEIGTDAVICEKLNLTEKIQALQKEVEEQKCRIEELVSINEDLLEFAQSKEEQLALLNKELVTLQGQSGGGALEDNTELPLLNKELAEVAEVAQLKEPPEGSLDDKTPEANREQVCVEVANS